MRQFFLICIAVIAVAFPRPALALEIRVDALLNRAGPNSDKGQYTMAFLRQDSGKSLIEDPILLQLNDVVKVRVSDGAASHVVDRWEGTETWEEKRKSGKTTIVSHVKLPHRPPIEVRLGTQVKLSTAFEVPKGLEQIDNKEFNSASDSLFTITSANTKLRLVGLVNATAPPPALTHSGWPKNGWEVGPTRVPIMPPRTKLYTITVTIPRN